MQILVMHIISLILIFQSADNEFESGLKISPGPHSFTISDQAFEDSSLTMVRILDKISGSLQITASKIYSDYPSAVSIADSAAADLAFMKFKWKKGSNNPAVYKQNLLSILKLIEIAEDSGSSQAFQIIKEAYEDIKIKTDFCRSNLVGPGEVVNINVRTKKDTSEVAGWQVVYMIKLMQLADHPQSFTFPKFSSPTSESLAPGIYRMWVQKPGTEITGKVVDVKVGDKEQEYDLPIPAGG